MHINEIKRRMQSGYRGFPLNRPGGWYGWCQALVRWTYEMINDNDPIRYGSAKAAWLDSPNAVSHDPYAAPPGALHWFTAGHPDYDVKISLGGGRVLHAYRDQDESWGPGLGVDSWDSAVRKASWVRDTYLGWTYGEGPGNRFALDIQVDEPGPPSGSVRFRNGVGVANLRALPDTSAAVVGEIASQDYGDFNAYTVAQEVSGENRWVRGTYSGNWAWLGSFTNAPEVSKLPQVADPRPSDDPTLRTTNDPVHVRSGPGTSYNSLGILDAGAVMKIHGWKTGESVGGIAQWFKVANGWVWSDGFTNRSTTGLTDLNDEPTPEPEPEPSGPDYVDFVAFSPVVTRVYPAHKNNYEDGRFPADQTEVVLHDFGTDGVDSYEGTLSWFRNGTVEVASHFVVSGDNIVQMVPLDKRAYHAGPDGNWHVGIEIDPAVGRAPGDPLREKTIVSVRKLLAALNAHYGRVLNFRKHSDFVATSCGDDINFDDYREKDPTPEPVPEDKIDYVIELLERLNDRLDGIFR